MIFVFNHVDGAGAILTKAKFLLNIIVFFFEEVLSKAGLRPKSMLDALGFVPVRRVGQGLIRFKYGWLLAPIRFRW